MFLEGRQASTPGFLAARGLTGLPADSTFYQFGSDARSYELAGFGELNYHLTDKLSVTGGLRYGKYDTTVDVHAGFNSLYFAYVLGGFSGELAQTPIAASKTDRKSTRLNSSH